MLLSLQLELLIDVLPAECLSRGCREVDLSPWRSNRTAKHTATGRSPETQFGRFLFAALDAQRRRRCSAACRSIDINSRPAVLCSCFFYLVFQTRGQKNICYSSENKLKNVTAGASGTSCSHLILLASSKLETRIRL